MHHAVVVIPAYQAQRTIRPLVHGICLQGLEVIVVDDASSDRTFQEASDAGAQVIRRKENGGKGAALRDGFSLALQDSYAFILTMDSDGQHLASDIPAFLKEAAQSQADLIVGNRMSNPRRMPWIRRLTNFLMSSLLSLLSRQRIPDTQCGFRLIRRNVLEKLLLTSDRFEIDSEIVIKSARAHFRIASVPVASVYPQKISFIRPFCDTIRFFRFLGRIRRERAGKPAETAEKVGSRKEVNHGSG